MSQCNYCSLKQIRTDAKKKKMKVVLIPSSFMGGTDVFVVPSHIKEAEIRTWTDCSDKFPNGDKNRQKYCVSWMMKIGNHCEC